MPTVELAYPPCAKRLVGMSRDTVTQATCVNSSSVHYKRLVRPSQCRRCLAALAVTQSDQHAATGAAPPPKTPNLLRRTLSYAEAFIDWTAAGKPERSDEEVQRTFHQFCKPCRWFDRRRQICRGCGCRVADNGFAILNKIKMATQHCPRNLW